MEERPGIQLPDIELPPGSCWLVATPIGNLADVSLRALSVLSGVDLVFAEDTRRTRILMSRYGIRARLESFHDHNKERQVPKVIERLRRGETIALVSDAGMPAIADPGFVLVRALREAELTYTVVPGPSSVLTALVLSGMPTDRFLFAGYTPRKSGRLRTFLTEMLEERGTVVMLESIHRIRKTLEALQELAPDREAAVVREITKIHEEVLRGTAADLLLEMDGPRLKGELVLLLRGK